MEMKKLREISFKDIINPVRNLINSDRFFLTKVINTVTLQEHWITRFLAVSLDYIMLFFVAGLAIDSVNPAGTSIIAYIVLTGIVSVFYFTLTESFLGYTLGKRLFNLKVVTETGDKPNLKNALIRNISKIFFVALIADLLFSYFTPHKLHQRYVDKIAHTTVKKMESILTPSILSK